MSNMRRIRMQRSARRGTTMIEFALVAMMLMLFLLGIMQFGVIYFTSGTLNNACREGARYASVHPNDDDAIKAEIRKRVGGIDASPNVLAITIDPLDGNRNADSRLKVTVSYPLVTFMPFMADRTLVSSATMRIEAS